MISEKITNALPSVEMSLYKILTNEDLINEGLRLLKGHAQKNPEWAKNARLDTNSLGWKPDIRKLYPDSLPFCQAVGLAVKDLAVSLVIKDNLSMSSETLIKELLEIDPTTFSLKNNRGQWVAFQLAKAFYQNENQWYQHKEIKDLDRQIAMILDSLPDEAFNDEEAESVWIKNIANGISGGFTHQVFRKRAPRFSLINLDDKGQPFMKKAIRGEAWEDFLKEGGDPFQLINGIPLWQTFLPQKTGRFFVEDSLEGRVEQWIIKKCRSKDADPAMKKFLEKSAMERMKNVDIVYAKVKSIKSVLSHIPKGNGLFMELPKKSDYKGPFWNLFFMRFPTEVKFWARTVYLSPMLKSRIHEDPVLEAMLVALWAAEGKVSALEVMERAKNTLNTARFQKNKEKTYPNMGSRFAGLSKRRHS